MRSIAAVVLTALLATFVGFAHADDDDDPRTPQQRARIAATDAALREMAASSLRLRVLFSNERMEVRGELWLLLPSDELPALVDAARGSTDPLVLMLLAEKCSKPSARRICDPLTFAQRWVEADTQNQLAWLMLAHLQGLSAGNAAAQATYVRAAQASTFRNDMREATMTVLRAMPKDLAIEARADLLEAAYGRATGVSPLSAMQAVAAGCKDATLRDFCHRILEVMARDAQDLVTLSITARCSQLYGVAPAVVAERYRRLDRAWTGVESVRWPQRNPLESAAPEDAPFIVDRLERLIRLGELAAAEHDLQDSGIAIEPAIAARRSAREARDRRNGFPPPAVR